jgi:hypothetical protein
VKTVSFFEDFTKKSCYNEVVSTAPYFSPLSRSEPQKKIVFLAENINEEAKSVIKSIYQRSILDEINNRDANEMLVRSTGIPLSAPPPTAQSNLATEAAK